MGIHYLHRRTPRGAYIRSVSPRERCCGDSLFYQFKRRFHSLHHPSLLQAQIKQ
jgi:hypothetical protein